MSIGANILAPWVNDRARMYDYLVRLNPRMVVVCDEPVVAAQVKAALPDCTVIHRWIVDGDSSHTNWSVGEWVRSFALPLPPGVMGYCLNEPGGDWRALSAWLADVMSLCGALHIPLCVGNFSKGNPPVDVLNAGELDALLMAFNEWPLHRLGYHPYWTADPDTDAHASWHVPILRRAGQIGARVRLFATESGRDERGAYEDGYRNHMTSAAFAEKETRHAAALHKAGIPSAAFCYGKGGPEQVIVNGVKVERFKWEQFDWQNDSVVQAAFATFNAAQGDDDMAGPPGWAEVTMNNPALRANVRQAPSLTAQPLASVGSGEWVKPQGAPVAANGHRWQRVVLEDCRTGYVSLNVLKLGEVTR